MAPSEPMPRYLVLLASQEDLLTRGLFGTGQETTQHDRIGTGHDGLGYVAGVVDTTIRHQGDTGGLAGLGGVVYGGELGHTNTRHHAGGADGTGAHTDLDRIHSGIDESLGALLGGDVATDDIDMVEGMIGPDPANHVEHELGVAVGGIDHEHIHARIGQSGDTLPGVSEESDRCGHPQATLLILGGLRILLGLDEVLDGNQARKFALSIHQGELLHLVLGQEGVGIFLGDVGRSGNQVILGHDVADLEPVEISRIDETHVTVGDDADQTLFTVDDREARHLIDRAELVQIGQGGIRGDGQRI